MIIAARVVSARMLTLPEDLARKHMFGMISFTRKKVLCPRSRRVIIDARMVRHAQDPARKYTLDVVSLTW